MQLNYFDQGMRSLDFAHQKKLSFPCWIAVNEDECRQVTADTEPQPAERIFHYWYDHHGNFQVESEAGTYIKNTQNI